MNEPEIETLSDRAYRDGQGYEMTRLVNGWGNRLRAIAHAGNRVDYHFAKVERWDGTRWHKVVELHGDELAEPPSYVCWDYDREINGRKACEDWLHEACIAALAYAQEVLT